MKKLFGAAMAVAMLAFAAPAQAQSDTSSPALGNGGDENASKDGRGQLGNWGVGLMGQTNFAVAGLGGLGGAVLTQQPLTTLGARYWFQNAGGNTIKALGLDAGLGLGISAGDGPTEIGFGLHLGLPMALSMHKHVNFELIPELNIAFGHSNAGVTGVDFNLGVRAGFEVFFGFIGIPQLALEATVGAGFTVTSVTNNTRFFFGTDPGHTEPWNIFSPGIAARYYF